MDARESAAVCELAGQVMADVTSLVEGVHRGILGRVISGLSLGMGRSLPVGVIEAPTRAIYATVRGSGLALGHVSAAASLQLVAPQSPPAHSGGGAAWFAGLSAALGDQLEADERLRPLAPSMAFRRRGEPLSPRQVADEIEANRPWSIAIFLHGLGCTERQFTPQYAAVMAEHNCASYFVRYNTGRSIEDNGADLSHLLDQLIADERANVGRIILVGHSLGGLVARAAMDEVPSRSWVARVSDLVTLGSPHRGAPMEKVAAVALTGLGKLPETRPFTQFGNRRAVGIKDLRFGALRKEHWGGRHPDEVLRDTTSNVPLPRHVRHHAVVATLGEPGSIRGMVLGDGLVREASASGRSVPGDPTTLIRLHRTGHMQLTRHPRVAALLADVAAVSTQTEAEVGS